jgi:hypothetical protein
MGGSRRNTKPIEKNDASAAAAVEDLPPVNEVTNELPPADELVLEPLPPEPRAETRIGLSLPFGNVNPLHHHKRHVDLQLNKEQAATLARITTALRGQPYELEVDGSKFRTAGRMVVGPAQVFYWLLNGATLLMRQADAQGERESSGDSEAK